MKRWLLLPAISAPMSFQMAFDEILFRRMIEARDQSLEPIFRFYHASEPWITVGYSHPGEDEALKNELNVCRRLTGGGVVHHGEDLIFSLIAKKTHDDSFMSVKESYRKIHWALQTGFGKLGAKTEFYGKEGTLPRGAECFRHPIDSDLSFQNQKIAGGAQKRSLGVMLHQESLQLGDVGRSNVAQVLENQLPQKLLEGFREIFEVEIEKHDLDPDWIFQAEKLAEEKYSRLWSSNK